MLVLSRRTNEEVRFPSLDIRVRVLKATGAVKLGIDAPANVRILREEIEKAVSEVIPTQEQIARLPKEARHEIRNQLQTINIGLHLLREQINAGDETKAERTID